MSERPVDLPTEGLLGDMLERLCARSEPCEAGASSPSCSFFAMPPCRSRRASSAAARRAAHDEHVAGFRSRLHDSLLSGLRARRTAQDELHRERVLDAATISLPRVTPFEYSSRKFSAASRGDADVLDID